MTTGDDVLLRLAGATVWYPGADPCLADVDWTVRPGEHWALLGPNGAGKSTLLALAGAVRHPSRGTVEVLGRRLGRTDLRELRAHVGAVDGRLRIPPAMTVRDYVLTGATGTVQPLPGRYGPAERQRADDLLRLVRMDRLAGREVITCSAGEAGRARIARALMPQPRLLLLDEPATGLDLPGREDLLAALAELAGSAPGLATVVVAHHLEDLPETTSHALLLHAGRVLAAGPVGEVLTRELLSACFGRPLAVARDGGRWSARALRPADGPPPTAER